VLFLILAFFSAASIWLLLEAEFLAITLILVYVGAVMVLFLFVIKMLNAKNSASSKSQILAAEKNAKIKNSTAFAALREKIIANELAINQNESI
jgi:NADH:ubiquinone oxidoreductase subunit 6 (subunit J)